MRPSLIRPKLNELEKRLLLQLRVAGSMPRNRLAALLGASSAMVTRATQQLIGLDLLEECDADDLGVRGRPTVPVAISGKGAWSVGATVQPGWLEIEVLDFCGKSLIHDAIPFESPDPLDFAKALDVRLRELLAQRGIQKGRFLGLGVAVAGYAIDSDPARRIAVNRLGGWSRVPLADIIGDTLDMPVWIENDATAAALAEFYQQNVIERYKSILALFLGQGVGAGVVAARDLFHGDYGNAGEIGKLFPGDLGRPSGIDLLQTLRAAGAQINSLADVSCAMTQHAAVVDQWVERVAQQLEVAVTAGAVWMDPGAIVISGALPIDLLHRLAVRIDELSKPRHEGYCAPCPSIIPSCLGSRAVVIGAAMVPIHAVTALADR